MEQNKKNFYIPRIEGEMQQNSQREEKKYRPEGYVSSISGYNVKNEDVFPYVKYENKGLQYEIFRDKKLMSDEELKQKYGTKYYEFQQLFQTQEYLKQNTPSLETQRRIPDYLRREDITPAPNEFAKELNERISRANPTPVQPNKVLEKRTDSQISDYDYFENIVVEENYAETTPIPINKKREEEDYFGSADEIEMHNSRTVSYSKNNDIFKPFDIDDEPEEFVVSRKSNIVEGYNTKTIKKSGLEPKAKKRPYVMPPLELLKKGQSYRQSDMTSVNYQRNVIDRTLAEFKILGHVVHFTKGPAVTQFEIKLEGGVKVEKIKGIAKNLQMNLQCRSLRIEAPIPGKSTVGIEVPNIEQDFVLFGELLSNPDFLKDNNPLNTILGLDIAGNPVYLDIADMPHGLVAGTTGSGKSVCINGIINSIIYKAHPDDVKLILIDPKIIEFSSYENIPHLACPVINDAKLATATLKWAVDEMDRRYTLFKTCKRRDIHGYNEVAAVEPNLIKLPFIVIIIDEMADLMSVSANSVEEYIQRIAQKARAAGIHLIMATQRPSTDIIKGTIKANIQTRIAFQVNSQVDSMTILDASGADKLLGKGDMLYSDGVNTIRVQGAYISEKEILAVTEYLSDRYDPTFMFSQEDLKRENEENEALDPTLDEYFNIVAKFVVENQSASINRIQKKFGVGFNRAQSIMDGLEKMGIVSEGLGARPRNVLITMEELETILDE